MKAITNGTIMTITGETIKNGTILVGGGKICAVGQDVFIPVGLKSSTSAISMNPAPIQDLGWTEILSAT